MRTRLCAAAARRPLAVTTQPCRPLPPQGLSAIAVCDKEYPSRVALSMLKDLVNEMKTGEHACVCCMRARARVARARARHIPPASPSRAFSAKWRSATVEGSCKVARLEALLRDYQDPTKVDKIAKVDKSLAETKEVLTKTIDAVLARGEKLDDLVDRSAELSASSKMFYKTAKSTNSCVPRARGERAAVRRAAADARREPDAYSRRPAPAGAALSRKVRA